MLVDPDDALLEALMAPRILTALQLHGSETPARTAEIASNFGIETWKVISVKRAADVAAAALYSGAAQRILFDAKTPDDASRPGGMGLRFDWSLLSGWKGATPWGLAGGLTPENVAEAIAATGASLVDTSSGVESAPGIKDVGRVAAFTAAVRGA